MSKPLQPQPKGEPMTLSRNKRMIMLAGLVLAPGLTGCISVRTPEKPIEINLNVRIQQEVLVRLQRDVEQLIEQNPEIFPQEPQTPGGSSQ